MDDQHKKIKLLNFVRALVKKEQELRAKHNIGDRYRAVSNRFKSMLSFMEENVHVTEEELAEIDRQKTELPDSQQYVYVYLFNAKGRMLHNWVPMLSPRVFSEYSVNRPVYATEVQVDAYIRSRPNSDAHAYLIVRVEKNTILQAHGSSTDSLGQKLLKLRESSLQSSNLDAFVYKGQRYLLQGGQLVPEELLITPDV